MNILYIIRDDPDDTSKTIMAEQNKVCEITIVDIRNDRRYENIVDLIEACDRVICW